MTPDAGTQVGSGTVRTLELADFLLIAEAVLGRSPDREQSLKDGNAPVALMATIEFCQRNGHPWWPPPGDEDGAVTATRFLELAAAPLTDDAIRDLATLVGRRMGQDDRGPRT